MRILENSTWFTMRKKEPAFMIVINMTERCNLSCVYCYEHSKRGRDLEYLNVMATLDRLLREHHDKHRIIIQFSGGEPLLKFEAIQLLIEHVRLNYINNPGWKAQVRFGISTNGTLLNDEIKLWLMQNEGVSLSVSLDGTEETHNRNRSNSYALLAEHFNFIRSYDIPVKMTLSPYSIRDCAKGIKHIHSLGFECTGNLVFENVWGPPEKKKAYLKEFSVQLNELIDYYADHPEVTRATMMMPLMENLPFNHNRKMYRNCGMGKGIVAIDVDGSEYLCHRFTPMCTNRPPGDIQVEPVVIQPRECAGCPIVPMCPGCSAHNYEVNGNVNHKTMFHCEFFQLELRASSLLTFRDMGRIRTEIGLDNLNEEEKGFVNQRIRSALFVEEYTRPLKAYLDA